MVERKSSPNATTGIKSGLDLHVYEVSIVLLTNYMAMLTLQAFLVPVHKTRSTCMLISQWFRDIRRTDLELSP